MQDDLLDPADPGSTSNGGDHGFLAVKGNALMEASFECGAQYALVHEGDIQVELSASVEARHAGRGPGAAR